MHGNHQFTGSEAWFGPQISQLSATYRVFCGYTWKPPVYLKNTLVPATAVYRAPCGGGAEKRNLLGLSAIAAVLQAAPGDDGLPPPGPPRHTSAAQCLTTRTHEASPCAGYPAHGGSLPATYPRKRGPRAWHTGVRQTAQRLGDRGRTSSRATQRHQPLARRTSLRPSVGTSARRGRTAQCGRQLALPAGLVGENRHGESRPPRRVRPLEGPQRAPQGGGGPRP